MTEGLAFMVQRRLAAPHRPAPPWAVCSLAAAILFAGCQGGVYSAHNLPPHLAAPPATGSQTIDLSRLAHAAVRTDLVCPGDVLEISMAAGLEDEKASEWAVRVSDEGAANIPLVGPVQLAGLELTAAEHLIRGESVRRGIYRDPHVSVLMKQQRSHRVLVVGEVEKPGPYDLPVGRCDLLEALAAAGGCTKDAGAVVEIRHPGDATSPSPAQTAADGYDAQLAGYTNGAPPALPDRWVTIDLASRDGIRADELSLSDGSVVMVMKKPLRTVQVIGLVNKPDEFEMPEGRDLRLLDALARAGDRKLQVADKVRIVRRTGSTTPPVVIETSVRQAKRGGPPNIRLADGDVVSVEETPLTFVVATIQNFIRFGFSAAIPGM